MKPILLAIAIATSTAVAPISDFATAEGVASPGEPVLLAQVTPSPTPSPTMQPTPTPTVRPTPTPAARRCRI
jgi:hypothetical protein